MKQRQRIVMHLDMDAFFAAVEERDTPRFRGKPIVVGGDPRGGQGRGVVSTANYAARKFGIHSGQSIKTAWKLAEAARANGAQETIWLPGSFRRYGETSDAVMHILSLFAPDMQQTSVDEAYADISFAGSFEKAKELAQEIKDAIVKDQKLTCSIGIGPNKLVAKIASDLEKPNGLTVIPNEMVLQVLSPLSVRAIPGVGPKTEQRLHRQGIRTIADLQKKSQQELEDMFGKWGASLYRKSRGQDTRPVQEAYVRKSIGEQRTFPEDTLDPGIIMERLNNAAADVFSLLKEKKFTSTKTITITVRFYDFQTISSAHTLPKPATTSLAVQREAMRLLLPFLDTRRNPHQKKIRLVGVRLEKLT